MKKNTQNTPTEINYQVQQVIEQMTSTVPKGTDLGLVDIISAMFSGYFVESGGGIMPAVDLYLADHISDERERAARSRRAAKSIKYGQYHLNELITTSQSIIKEIGGWTPTLIQEYRMKSVDMTAYKRSRVKNLKSKSYDSTANRAIPATTFGLMGSIGTVNGQRVAVLDMLLCGNTEQNEPAKELVNVYKKVAELLTLEDVVLFDAGFSLIDAIIYGIKQCLIRLSKNCTFGRTPGEIPIRTSDKGRHPSRHQSEIVRPMERQHGKNLLSQTPPDKTLTWVDEESGKTIKAEIWTPVYLLERHLDRLDEESRKDELRNVPITVIALHHPDYDEPLLLGTPLTELTPQSMAKMYPERWPIEGVPQTAKYLLSGGGGRHYVHHQQAMKRLPALSMIFGALFKYLAATFPPIPSGFWDRVAKPTYGRLLKYLKKVGLPLSSQLSKKASVTGHLPVGYEAVRLSRA